MNKLELTDDQLTIVFNALQSYKHELLEMGELIQEEHFKIVYADILNIQNKIKLIAYKEGIWER
jgi:hypothetical protein